MVGIHFFDIFSLLIVLALVVLPWVLGFAVVLPDANRRGQPGMLWALLTIPLGWFAVLGYLIVRSLSPQR